MSSIEWGVLSKDGTKTVFTRAMDEADAQRILSSINLGYPWVEENKIVTREVSDWREA